MAVVQAAAADLGIVTACDALGVPRSSYYRWRTPSNGQRQKPTPPRSLSGEERDAVLAVLHEDRFADKAPAEVYATLLDEGKYFCSISTMYRILRAHAEVRERRAQRQHPAYSAPELLAEQPNQLWSWDITRLKGPEKWSYFQLYVILDVYSRYIVGWMVAERESAVLAERLIAETCARQDVQSEQLTIHADRGSSMTSKPVAHLLADLGVTKTHSRPQVSNDNPYSESNFKTLKYRPEFPKRFGCLQDARAHVLAFVNWYNNEHHHAGINLLTPSDLHHGRAPARLQARGAVLVAAHNAHPERFVHGPPKALEVPAAAWINRPKVSGAEAQSADPQPAPKD